MKYREYQEGDRVIVKMPKGTDVARELEATVVRKEAGGVVLLQRGNGRRFWANSHRIERVIGCLISMR